MIEVIWDWLKKSFWGRLAASTIIPMLLGLRTIGGTDSNRGQKIDIKLTIILSICFGGAGAIVCLLFELRDYRRRKNEKWQRRINTEAEKIQREHPEYSSDLVRDMATERAEQRLSLLQWVGVGLGGLILLFGALKMIEEFVSFIRNNF